jgi:hypothetical protein
VWVRGGGNRTMRIQQDGHQHNHLRRQGAGLFVVQRCGCVIVMGLGDLVTWRHHQVL